MYCINRCGFIKWLNSTVIAIAQGLVLETGSAQDYVSLAALVNYV